MRKIVQHSKERILAKEDVGKIQIKVITLNHDVPRLLLNTRPGINVDFERIRIRYHRY